MATITGDRECGMYTVESVLQHNFSCGMNLERIHVQIYEAKKLAAKDLDGLSDPFVVVHFINKHGTEDKEAMYQTKVIPNNRNPVWDYETCSLNCQFGGSKKIQHRPMERNHIRDKDLLRTQFIGQCTVDVKTLTSSHTRKTYSLESRPDKNDKVTGTIDVGLRYYNQIVENDTANAEARSGLKAKEAEILTLIKELKYSEDKSAFIDDLAKIDTMIAELHDTDDHTSTTYAVARDELAKQVVDKVIGFGAYKDVVTDKRVIYKEIWEPLRLRFAAQANLTDENYSNKIDPILFSFCYPPSMELTEEIAKAGFAKQFLAWIDSGDKELREDMRQYYKSNVLDYAQHKHDDGDQAVKNHYGYRDRTAVVKHSASRDAQKDADEELHSTIQSFTNAINVIGFWLGSSNRPY